MNKANQLEKKLVKVTPKKTESLPDQPVKNQKLEIRAEATRQPPMLSKPGIVLLPADKKGRGGLQAKAKIVNARLAKYRNIAANVAENSKGNPLSAKLQSFLSAGESNIDALNKFAAEIIQNKKPVSKAIKILNRNQQLHLLRAAICYYLDKVCFNGKDEDSINVIQKVADRMIKAGIDMQSIYNYWDAAEVDKYVPGIDTDFIRQILTGKKKGKK